MLLLYVNMYVIGIFVVLNPFDFVYPKIDIIDKVISSNHMHITHIIRIDVIS